MEITTNKNLRTTNIECKFVPTFRNNNYKLISNPDVELKSDIPEDVLELSSIVQEGQNNKHLFAKIFGSICAAFVAIGAGIYAFVKHRTSTLNRLYNEKMKLVNLAEKIDFKEAKTVKEGIKFAKDILKVEEVSEDFTLDAINYVNKGLVDVSNANKGKLFIPKKLCFNNGSEKKYIAYVVQNIESPNFGQMAINKKYFDSNLIDKRLKKQLFYNDGSKVYELEKHEFTLNMGVREELSKDVKNLIKAYYKDSNGISIVDKRKLYFTLNTASDEIIGKINRFPMDTIKKYKDFIEKELAIKLDIAELELKTTEEQKEKLSRLMKELKKKDKYIKHKINLEEPDYIIYHEMGHLQDFAKNLKELHIRKWKNFFSSKISDDFLLDNRWSGLTYKNLKEQFKNRPKLFKKKYPDLYEFLKNQKSQQTAGKISWYAQTSIGEFIAETYAKMIKGEKIPDDVMDLYKKYNGPKIPFG